MSELAHELISSRSLQSRLSENPPVPAQWRETLDWAREEIYSAFRGGASAAELVNAFTAVNDQVLQRAWENCLTEGDLELALLAVGGYGRGELLPHSDIDLLILCTTDSVQTHGDALERFVAFCWDIGLEIGHSVRTIEDCSREAAADLTVATNLMESRRLAGSEKLAAAMTQAVSPQQLWPADKFFRAKFDEQKERHRKFDDTGYRLEPNVKEGPGGLRDIQMIVWMTQRVNGTGSLDELRASGLLTEKEAADLFAGRDFLWRVRFALHMINGRCEDRLLFDHQIRVSELFGFIDQTHNLAVEQFMQLYYRTIKGLSVLNDILLQLVNEQIFHPQPQSTPQPLSDDFELRNDFIESRDPDLFQRRPLALMEVFELWSAHDARGVKGIGAATLRLMRRDRNLIQDELRDSVAARELFMRVLRQPRGVLHTLRRMNRYGILGRYIPAFGRVIGRMQYDLFHTLTVDEHTLFVVRNMRRLVVPEYRHEFPELSALADRVIKPELLYLAGLFHDIGKGREGDHSELGAVDAREFCLRHGLASADAALVAWLVGNHLLMSLTAQRKDVSDPQEVNDFAAAVETQDRLDYLYLLTVCDIRATNPSLWNGFRAGLLRSLYISTRRTLERGTPVQDAELIAETQALARTILLENGLTESQIDGVWSRCDGEYFMRHSGAEVAWHTQALINGADEDHGCILVRHFPGRGTAVFLHLPDARYLFAATTATLAQLGVNILDARIFNTTDGYTMDTFVIADSDRADINSHERRTEIREKLAHALQAPDLAELRVTRRVPLNERHFSTPTQLYFNNDSERGHTVMELVAADRPGLLSGVGKVFAEMNIELRAAKIGTIGERAEDVFFLGTRDGKPLEDAGQMYELRERISAAVAESAEEGVPA